MSTTATTTTYDLQLGAFTARYRVFETTAPVDYDGFGTISLHENVGPKEPRWVLVREEHSEWQTMRYRSGMYGVSPLVDGLDEVAPWITEQLHKRLVGVK